MTIMFFIRQGRAFTFDKVFRPSSTQEYVYTESAKPIVSGDFLLINSSNTAYYQNQI